MAAPQMQKQGNAAEAAALRKYQYRKSGKTPTLEDPKPTSLKRCWCPTGKFNLSKEQSETPTVGAMVGPMHLSAADDPVVVLDIPFDTGVERTLPLNWKLSRKQKEWYQVAWDQIFFRYDDEGFPKKGELTELLDNYFKQK